VIEYLSDFFLITVFYYNPNISELEEYNKRAEEQKKLIEEMPTRYPVEFVNAEYKPEEFYQIAKGLETCKEGGERCKSCFELRLQETAKVAKDRNFDFFTTTLTISPLKNAEIINEIGKKLELLWEISFLPSDFKKKNGYKRSTELSKEYNLYRQDYCGCVYSKVQRDN
jgi:predicted adenine nucleotide alpha hydrolase (AANH) superfamily ATPase